MTENKYYSYSVKKTLSEKYGAENTVFQMRSAKNERHDKEERKDIISYCWKHADEEACRLFIDTEFLLDTIIEDDYIAYISQLGSVKKATLLFMTIENESYFNIAIDYAESLVELWEAKGYKCLFCNERVCLSDREDDGFWVQSRTDHTFLYRLSEINGVPCILFDTQECWQHYYKRMVSVVHNNRIEDYECLFDSDVKITKGANKQETIIGQGLEFVKQYLCENAPVRIIYEKLAGDSMYMQGIAAGNNQLILTVNRANLICGLNVRTLAEKTIDDKATYSMDLVERVPCIKIFNILDHIKMHGCVIKLTYEDNTIRNYYFHMYQNREPDTEWDKEGYHFSYEEFKTVRLDENDNIVFSNGYVIPKHILYYHSYRQADIEKTGNVFYDKHGKKIISIYREPLKCSTRKAFSVEQYLGFEEECFGPKKVVIDEYGNRIGNISAYSLGGGSFDERSIKVCMEPTNRYGFLLDDGTWLIPPIYLKAYSFSEQCEVVVRIVEGKEQSFFLNAEGTETLIDNPLVLSSLYEMDLTNGRCPVNTKEWNGERPYLGYYYEQDYDFCNGICPGKWGFIDEKGKMVIEPKYVYAVGFWNAGEKHSVVARFVDGKLCWGLIDLDGNEVIPCRYPDLYSINMWDGFVAFQDEKTRLYGLMTYDGEIIVAPKFKYIDDYDKEHQYISAGEYEHLGVYSIKEDKMILPENYDCIEFGHLIISAEISFTGIEKYYDYNGNELDFSEYDSVSDYNEHLLIWKNGKDGVIDINGNTIIPPVLDSFRDDTLYWKGYIITGELKKKGLKKVTGEIILPELYTEIKVVDDFIIASEQIDGNWRIRDTLFNIEGEAILEGAYRRIWIDSYDNTIIFETPFGIEHCNIINC